MVKYGTFYTMLKTVTVPWSCPALKNSSGQLFAEHLSVHLNGQPVQVRSCRESAIPFNRVWPGKQRSRSQTELAGFAIFSADEPLTVELETVGAKTGLGSCRGFPGVGLCRNAAVVQSLPAGVSQGRLLFNG